MSIITGQEGPINVFRTSAAGRRELPSDRQRLRGAELSRALQVLDYAHVITLRQLIRLLPSDPYPTKTIAELVDAGVLGIEPGATFSNDTLVWRAAA